MPNAQKVGVLSVLASPRRSIRNGLRAQGNLLRDRLFFCVMGNKR